MGRHNLWDALAADQVRGRIGRPYELTPPVVPVRTFFCRSRTRYLLACGFPAFSAGGSGNRKNRGAVLAPAELAAIDPHPVQNHGQAPGDRDDGSTYPAPLSHPHAPRLQPRPFPALDKQRVCGLVEHRAQQGVATFGYPAIIVDLAGLVALWRQADMRADRPGMDEALR